jgi:poly(3-hydroxybutyrate) depolymerase
MIYTLHELQHAANAPLKFWAETSQQLFTNPFSPLAYLPHSSRVAAGSELMARVVRRYEKPAFGHAHTVINGANVSESSADDLWEVAAALIDEFRQMSDHCLEIAAALQPLADLQPPHDN